MTAIAAWVGHYAGHGQTVEHTLAKSGQPEVVIHDSTHGLWAAIIGLGVGCAILAVVAVHAHMDRRGHAPASHPPEPPTLKLKIEVGAAQTTGSSPNVTFVQVEGHTVVQAEGAEGTPDG